MAHLAERIDAAEFDYVILLFRFEAADPDFGGWYGDQFGKTVMSAVKSGITGLVRRMASMSYAPR